MPVRLDLKQQLAGLLGTLFRETDGNLWLALETEQGTMIERTIGVCMPLPIQTLYAKDCLRALNQHADFDGCWIAAWADVSEEYLPGAGFMQQPQRLIFLFKDTESDTPFLMDTDEPLPRIVGTPPLQRVEHAIQAREAHRELLRDVEIRPSQMRRRVQGEAPADPNLRVIPYVN